MAGYVYKRGDSGMWWLAYYDVAGKRRLESSGTTDQDEAKKLLRTLQRRIDAEREAGVTIDQPLTVRRYSERWIADRRARGISSADVDESRLAHVLPAIGDRLLKDVRRKDIRQLMRDLMVNGRVTPKSSKRRASEMPKLAPRTLLHIYGVLRVMFGDAVAEELIDSSPCTLKQRLGELPKKRDKDPRWRHTAVFTKAEVEAIISDLRIPQQRRVLYALMFLTGCRINEVTPRRWRDYDREMKPLGRLLVATSYSPRSKTEKAGTKTDFVREVPVHKTLAKVLAAWRMTGWEQHQGRKPTEDDLIVARSKKWGGGILNSNRSIERFHLDLVAIGLRPRRQHDARRTFISLGIAHGARENILRWVSHGPSSSGEAFDAYQSIPWETLCAEVSKLNVELREGKVVRLAATALLRRNARVRNDS